jgi:hypothetical protein
MQAFAISVVLMSGACGSAAGIPHSKLAPPPAVVVEVRRSSEDVARATTVRYDSNHANQRASTLSRRSGTTLRDR